MTRILLLFFLFFSLAHGAFAQKKVIAQARTYIFSQIRFALLAVALCAITWLAVQKVTMDKMQGMALKGVVAGLVSSGLILLLFHREVMAYLKQRFAKEGSAS